MPLSHRCAWDHWADMPVWISRRIGAKGSAEVRVTLGAIDPYPDDAGRAMVRDRLRDGAMQFWVIRSYAVNENLSDLNPGCNQI
jgi:hypothetical protein